MTKKDQIFRRELKYLLSRAQASLVQQRLQQILQRDQALLDDSTSYRVTSLYFDDYQLSSYFNKLDGHPKRAKFRLRAYDLNDDKINFEVKIKNDEVVRKETLRISKADYLAIIKNGDLSSLAASPWSAMLEARLMKPKIIVDYWRTPLVWQSGQVRVTLDDELQVSTSDPDIFKEENQIFYPVLAPDQVILEVKYNNYLPVAISQLLSEIPLHQIAVSKYTLAMQRARSLHTLIRN